MMNIVYLQIQCLFYILKHDSHLEHKMNVKITI